MAVDAGGNVYVAGDVSEGAGYTFEKQKQVFVAKFSPTGQLIYQVYFGGHSDEYANSIAVDSKGRAVVTGITFSSDNESTEEVNESFPVTANAYQKEYGRMFVSVVNSAGDDLHYSTFVNGDDANAVAVDNADKIYITGDSSNRFKATPGAYQSTSNGVLFGAPFIVKIDPDKTGEESLVYATLFGGPDVSGEGWEIEVDAAGNAYVAGQASSGFLATPNAAQKAYGGGMNDAFLVKINPTGSDVVYATFLGGDDYDNAMGLTLDAEGNAYITGGTYLDFPTTPNAFQKQYHIGNCGDIFKPKACSDAFVAKLNPAGSQWLYATYLGGEYHDWGNDISVDGDGVVTVVGRTMGIDFPTLNPIQDDIGGGGEDAFIVRLNPEGSALLFSSYFGGRGEDEAYGLGVHEGKFYIAGQTWSTDFPLKNPFQEKNEGELDGFLAQITFADAVPAPKGDINGDAQVNILDATLALRYSVGIENPTAEQSAAAEMNGDGKVTVADAILILRRAVGLPVD